MDEIAHFQIAVAEQWIARTDTASDADPAFAYVGYFSALNALYWLWGLVEGRIAFTKTDRDAVGKALQDRIDPALAKRVLDRLGSMRGEGELLASLIARLGEDVAKDILTTHRDAVEFLCRRGPIRRMDRRTARDGVGDPKEGAELLKCLSDGRHPSSDRLEALAKVLYLIRCNLVHGSKVTDAEDGDLLRMTVPPLRALALTCKKVVEADVEGDRA